MDRQSHDYAAASAMAYAQQQQQFGFHPQHQQQFAPPPSYMSPHPPMQQFPYPPRYPPPPHHHHQQQQQHLLQQQHFPPLNLPPHGYPSVRGPYDTPPPPPPSDPELQKRIEKLVEYAAKNGPEFEAMIREKQQDNPGYSFLFGGEGHTYYRYKLWMSTHPPFNAPFPPPMVVAAAPPPPPPPFYDPPRPSHAFALPARLESKPFVSPLPPGVSLELANVLNTLNGTKESIKGAKTWFLQRSPFAPALAQALRDWVFSLDDSHTQLHAIYLANDILLDSLQRRASPHELDNEAFAFKPVLGSMLARAYHNPQNKDENQPQLQKILQFWASMKVYDQDTIYALESEMVGGPPTNSFPGPPKEPSTGSDTLAAAGFTQPSTSHTASQWQADRQSIMDQEHPDKQMPHAMPPSLGTHQYLPNSVSGGAFPGSMAITSSVQSINQQPAPHSVQAPPANVSDKLPPYPLFPPGLIPGMVKKMQIGSGVPYSPLSPLDIPTVIPPSNVSPSETLERVSKFFKEIGEVNPMEGSVNSQLQDEDDEYGRDAPIRKGGACIPPPPNLQVDPETGIYADGSVERKPGSTGSARLGLGATADPNEASQYDDVYTSYRKQRSTTYHSSMSSRAATR